MRHPSLTQEQRDRLARRIWTGRQKFRGFMAYDAVRHSLIDHLRSGDIYAENRTYASAMADALEQGSLRAAMQATRIHYSQPEIMHPSGMTHAERNTVAKRMHGIRRHWRDVMQRTAAEPEREAYTRQRLAEAVDRAAPEKRDYDQAVLDAFIARDLHRLFRLFLDNELAKHRD